jgi:hypothetical protein
MRYQKLNPDKKEEVQTAVLLLRFKTTTPTKLTYKFISYKRISKIVKLDYNSVQHICRKAVEDKSPTKTRHPLRKLDQEHIDYLISEHTLEQWAGLTLSERCAKFEHVFKPKRLNETRLRRIYLKHKITRKAVRDMKPIPEF